MQRKAIRATVGGSDQDIPIGVFAAGQYLIYANGEISTATIAAGPTGISGPASAAVGQIATWANTSATQLQAATVTAIGGALGNVSLINGTDPSTWVTGVSPSAIDQVAVFNTTAANIIKSSPVTIGATGAVAGVQTINGIAPSTWTVGAASSSDNAIARFDGTSGKLIQNSVVAIDDTGAITGVVSINGTTWTGDYVRGPTPAVSVSNNVTTWDGTSGRLIKDSTLPITNVVYTTGGEVVTGHIPQYADSSGRRLSDSGLISANVVSTGLATATVDNSLVVTDGTTGRSVKPTPVIVSPTGALTNVASVNGVAITGGWVVGPNTSTDNAIARYDGTTGKLVQNSNVSVSDFGDIAGVASLNGIFPASIVTAASNVSTDGTIAVMDGTGGRAIKSTAIGANGTALTNVGSINGLSASAFVTASGGPVVDNTVVRYDGTTGRLVQGGQIAYSDTGVLSGVEALTGNGASAMIINAAAGVSLPNVSSINGVGASNYLYRLTTLDSGKLLFANSGSAVASSFIGGSGGDLTNVSTINGIAQNLQIAYYNGVGLPFNNEIACFNVPGNGTGGVTASYRPVTIDTSGNISGVSTINGFTPGATPAHASNHAIGGSDSIYSGTWGSGDGPNYVANGSALEPRFRKVNLTTSTSIGTTFTNVPSGSMTLAPRATQYYYCEWTLPCTIADGTINFEVRVTWSSGSGTASLHVGQGMVTQTSGGTIANNAGYACVKVHLALFGAGANAVVNCQIRRATSTGTLWDGSLVVLQTT